MGKYDAKLLIQGEDTQVTPVVVDLTGDRVTLSIGEEEVADWAKDRMRIQALPDGFHIMADGEAVVLDVDDDARFALELGMRNAHPALRRRMSALLRSDS